MKYGWLTFDPKIWYKAKMDLNLGQLVKDEGVFVKVNTEILEREKSFWVIGAKRKVMHLSEEMLGEYVRLKLQGNQPIPTTIEETQRLNDVFKPVLDEVKQGRERSQRIMDRLKNNPSSFQGKRANIGKKGSNQGELF